MGLFVNTLVRMYLLTEIIKKMDMHALFGKACMPLKVHCMKIGSR